MYAISMGLVVALGFLVGPPGAAFATDPGSSLTVTMRWAPGLTDTWTLRCDPVGGTHPNRVRACALLGSLKTPFTASPTGIACTMIYSGPERAHVVGQWRGAPVDTTFDRTDGCATVRWRQYRELLTDPGTVTLRGHVNLGPTCPVQRPGDNCETVGATATVTATSGARHRTVRSGANGFALRVPRAMWTLTADAGMACDTVVVDARTSKNLAPTLISCDTGIRTAS